MAPWISAIRFPCRGSLYYRYFLQNVDNGNAPNDTPCTDDDLAGLLCTGSGVSTTFGGVPIPDFLNGAQYGELDMQRTSTNAYGAAVQVTDTHDVFGLKNHFVAGFAFDGAQTQFNAASYVGGLTTNSRTFIGPGIVIDEPGQNSPVSVGITNATWGVYFADTLKVTDRLTATVRAASTPPSSIRPISTAATSAARTAICISIPRPASPTMSRPG